MKKIILISFLVICSNAMYCQGFEEPSHGKAILYFIRVTGYGSAASFEYFHNDNYIGAFKGKNYLAYECDPGKHLFWVSTENKEFLSVDLKEGGTYIVIVDVEMGAWKARVGLTPITDMDVELFERAKELVQKKPAKVTPNEKIQKMNLKLKEFIKEQLYLFDTEWKNTRPFGVITPEMAISPDKIK